MCVGVTLWFGCGGVISVCRLSLHTDTTPPQPNQLEVEGFCPVAEFVIDASES